MEVSHEMANVPSPFEVTGLHKRLKQEEMVPRVIGLCFRRGVESHESPEESLQRFAGLVLPIKTGLEDLDCFRLSLGRREKGDLIEKKEEKRKGEGDSKRQSHSL